MRSVGSQKQGDRYARQGTWVEEQGHEEEDQEGRHQVRNPEEVGTLLAAAPEAVPSTDERVEDTDHYANGQVKYTGFRLSGEMHGAWSFYRTDGSLMRSGKFDRGKQIATWRTFDRSGKVIKETSFDV